ncbi:hypothetical protein BGX26_004653 [Mortierella sp. AD094]|nr:hypothetical protein BGX26_004653 [Mortierella sp. AD094]
MNIPELDHIVYLGLDQPDLARCARVCKVWNRAVIPYLWSNVELLGDNQKKAFLDNIVLEDYYQSQQDQQPQEGEKDSGKSAQEQTPLSCSPLLKYGPFISMMNLIDFVRYISSSSNYPRQQEISERFQEPDASSLLGHLFKRCPSIHLMSLILSQRDIDNEDFMTPTTTCILPRVRSLVIGGHRGICRLESSKLKFLLAQCSSELRSLTLGVNLIDTNIEMSDQEDAERLITALPVDNLSLLECTGCSGLSTFSLWLWKRCGNVVRMEVAQIRRIVKSLAEAISTYMPNLQEIQFGRPDEDILDLPDQDIALLLSSPQKGWKVVEAKKTANFGKASCAALVKHCHTLESYYNAATRIKDDILVQVLSSSPNLHAMITIDNTHCRQPHFQKLEVKKFIDFDITTNSLKMWACEVSLRELRVMIVNIPRPDLGGRYTTIVEEYLGQGQVMQNQVYERIARFVNLEVLWLGNDPSIEIYRYGYYGTQSREHQCGCLEMSLESGLEKLAGLKSLRELNVSYMCQRIGPKEVEWMARHWPSLQRIYGLDGDGDGNENGKDDGSDRGDDSGGENRQDINNYSRRCNLDAMKWLREHCAKIRTK